MTRVRDLILASLLASLPALTQGCAGLGPVQRGDSHFAAGDFPAAEAAYRQALERRPAGRGSDRILYQLILVYSLPASPAADGARAREVVSRLRAQFPTSPYLPLGERLVAREREVEDLRQQLEATRRVHGNAEARIRKLEEDLGQARQRLDHGTERFTDLAHDLEARKAEIRRLKEQLETGAAEIRRLQAELKKLKEIDLRSPP